MRKEKVLLLCLLLLKVALPFFLSHPVYDLHRDEYLYFEQGQHLDLGYLENPPLIGFLAAISSLFGGSFFSIKLWPALFGAATLWVTVQMVKEFGGGLYAQVIAAMGILFTAYLRIHFLFQPNFLDIFFWTLSAYLLLRFINTNEKRYLFYLAVSLSLGWYSKYSVLFFITALFGGLLLTYHRRVFTQKAFWLALLTGMLLVLPNLLWQYVHKWPLLHHMKELQDTQLQHLSRMDFLKDQLLMLLPVSFVWLGGLVWLLRQKNYRIVGYMFLLILLLLMLGSGKAYYALGAYPMMLAAGGIWTESLSLKRRWLRVAFAGLIFLLALPFVPLMLPMQKPADMAAFNQKYGFEKLGLLRWEDGQNHPLQQDFADMLGWEEVAQKTEILYQQQPDSVKASTIVYCANYGLAASMKYFANDPSFRDKIISENGTFLLWAPDCLYFKHLIYVDDEMPEEDDNVLRRFAPVTVVDSCTNLLSRQYGTKIFHFKNATDSAWIIAAQDIRKEKQTFSR
jgi:4-amino-4-deoxy-L-arabinose transferase-like glycosyltransferase